MKAESTIEILEARIAPAFLVAPNGLSATYTDVDGDLVTIRVSKPVLNDISISLAFLGGSASVPDGRQLARFDISGVLAADVAGLNLTITARPQDLTPDDGDRTKSGDGHVNVGAIFANGRNLGVVSIEGDLGEIEAGSGADAMAIRSLKVQSLFKFGTATGASDEISNIAGSLGTLKIAGDLSGGYVALRNGGSLGSAIIGGSIIGGLASNSGQIYAEGTLGRVTVKGSVVGSFGVYSGALGALGAVKGVTIGGSLLGGSGNNSGSIYSGYDTGTGDMGPIKIGGDVRGGTRLFGDAVGTGVITADGNITSVRIGGSLREHTGTDSGEIRATGDIGSVSIGGSIVAQATLEVLGTSGATVQADGDIKIVTVGGSVMGGGGVFSGSIRCNDITTLIVRGDVVGGAGERSGGVGARSIGSVFIGGSIVGGNDDLTTATDEAISSGTVLSDLGIGKLSVVGSIRGGSGLGSGVVFGGQELRRATIGGDVIGGAGNLSGNLSALRIDALTIRGNLLGGNGDHSGRIEASDGGIGKVSITGNVVGGLLSSFSGGIFSEIGPIGSIFIGGDLRGGGRFGSVGITESGTILGERIGAITIGGSIISGQSGVRAGSIHAVQEIGTLVVKGSIIGIDGVPVLITASGQAGSDVPDVAIKSITIGGSASFISIYAGFDKELSFNNSDAQIGTVKVGGDWTAGSISGTKKIASVIIAGQVLGQPGSDDTFNFVANEIVAFKYNGVRVPLNPGANNEGAGHVIGPSLSATSLDGFAVHLLEL
jgi:hypothetical protein